MKRHASSVVFAASAVIESLEDRKLFAVQHYPLGAVITGNGIKSDVLNVNSTGDSTVEAIKKLGIDSARLYLSVPAGTSSVAGKTEFLDNILALDSALNSAYAGHGFKIAVTLATDGDSAPASGDSLRGFLNNVIKYRKNGTGKSIGEVVDLWSIGNEINSPDYYQFRKPDNSLDNSFSSTGRLQHYIDNFLKPSVDVLSGIEGAELAAGSITYHAFPSSGLGTDSYPLTYLAGHIPTNYMSKLDYLDYHPYQSASSMPGLNNYVARVGKQYITRNPADTRKTVITTEWAADQQYYGQSPATSDPYPWSDATLKKWADDNAAVFTSVRDTYETSYYYGLTVDNYTTDSTYSHGAAALTTIEKNSSGVKYLKPTNYFNNVFSGWKDGSISGVLFTDDGDGTFEPTDGEKTVGSRVVFIDKDEDGTLDGNEPQATSDANGKYTLKYSLSPTATSTPIVYSGEYPVRVLASGSSTVVATLNTLITAAGRTVNVPVADSVTPAAPSGLTGTASVGAISLSWADNSGNETAFRLQRRQGSGAWSTVGTVGANVTTFVDSTVAAGTAYSYQIIADTNTASSNPSNTFNITAVAGTLLSPSADVYTWASNPTTNYATSAELNVKNGTSTTNRYAFMKFDLSNLNGTVNSAVLQIYGKRNNADDPGSLTFNVYDVASTSWTETGVTYNNMPSLGSVRGTFVSAAPNTSYALYQVDLTDYVQTQLASSTTIALGIAGATGGASAYLSVASKEAASNQPKLALGLTPITTPTAPSSLSASSVQANSVALSWADNSGNETGFEVRRRQGTGAWVTITTTAVNATAYTDTSVTPDQAYSYQVVAVNSAGTAASNTISVSTPAITPAAPSNLAATATSSSVTLTWTDNASNETGYRIERQLVGGSWESIATPASPLTTYTDNTVAEGTAYAYRVFAVNSAGTSPASNEFAVTTPVSVPAAPTSLTSTATSTSASLAWTDNATNEVSQRVERKTLGGAWASLATLAAGVQTYNDNTVTAGTTYVYRVFAVNTAGDSAASNESTVTIGSDVTTVPITVSADAWVNEAATTTNYGNFNILQAKKGSTGTNREIYLRFDITGVTSTATAATLTMEGFRSNSNDANGVVVAARDLDDTAWTELGTTWATKPTVGSTALGQITVTNTASGTLTMSIDPAYINAAKANGKTAISIALIGTATTNAYFQIASKETTSDPVLTVTQLVTPAAPTNLAATPSATAVALSWTDNAANETGYRVERQTAGGEWEVVATLAANANSYNDATVSASTSYAYRVFATNSSGDSLPAGPLSVTTPAAVPAAATSLVGSVTATTVSLTWDDNATNETGYRVERKTGGGSWTTVATLGVDASDYTDTGLSAQTAYIYRVFAVNAVGDSAASNELPITTQPGSTLSLNASADTYVRDGTFSNTWYGNNSLMQVKAGSSGVNRQVYLRFDLSQITSTVTGVTLRVWGNRSNTTDTNGFVLNAKGVADTWSEATTTWDTGRPAVDSGSPIGQVTVTNTSKEWITITIDPAYINAAKANSQTSVSIALIGNASTSAYFEVLSRETSTKPQLNVTL